MSNKPSRDLPHDSRIYSDLSGLYDRVFTHVFADRIGEVVGRLDIPADAKVLEVGIGTGLSLDAYPQHCDVTGIDLSEEMLERARRKTEPERHGHIHLRQMDGQNLEFDDNTFDYVTGYHVVTVVPDPPRLVREMIRVCKPGGRVVIINHFSSPRPFIRAVVNMVDPVTRILGWSTRLRLEEVLDERDIEVERRYKRSPLSLFTIVECRKRQLQDSGKTEQ